MRALPLHPVPLLLLLCAPLLGGCLFHNISPGERLRDAVVGLNDQARWTRMDLAVENVSPTFRPEWRRTRHDWGRNIQIGDVEIMDVTMAADTDQAVSVVAVSWYRYDTMTLRRTVLRQEWEHGSGTYFLLAESVVDGDPALIAPPPEPAAEEPDAPAQREAVVSASASTSS